MPIRIRRRPRYRRILRRGDRGDDVLRLQERLEALGYDVGPKDGVYGYLTEDAVLRFQQDYRLRVDGIAGPRLREALAQELPRLTSTHILQPGERLSDVAREHDVTLGALRWMNGMTGRSARLRPGKQLVIRHSLVVAGVAANRSWAAASRILSAEARRISAVALFGLRLEADGSITGEIAAETESFFTEIGLDRYLGLGDHLPADEGDRGEEEAGIALPRIASGRRTRKRFIASLADRLSAPGVRGLLLDPGPIGYGDGDRLVAALGRLREAAPGRRLLLTLPPPARGLRSLAASVDYEAAARRVDRLILATHRWEHLLDPDGRPIGEQGLGQAVARLVRGIPPWKVLLGVPVGAAVLSEDGALAALPYRKAVTDGYLAGKRPAVDDRGYPGFEVERDGRKARYILQGRGGLGRFLGVAHRFRLGGVYFFPVGEEDRRLWSVVADRLHVLKE